MSLPCIDEITRSMIYWEIQYKKNEECIDIQMWLNYKAMSAETLGFHL